MPRATERLTTPVFAHHQTPSPARTGFGSDGEREERSAPEHICTAASIGQKIAMAEEHLRCWENLSGRVEGQIDQEEEHLVALLDCLGRQLEWVQALTLRGMFVQLQQLRQLILKSREVVGEQESFETSLRMQRLATLLGVSLREAAEIGPTEYGQQTLWPHDRAFLGVADSAGLDLPLPGE
jgi:hypothetical protein